MLFLYLAVIFFPGAQTSLEEFKEFLFSAFPKLREGRGFELLVLIPCANEVYHVRHLKDPQNQIGHATIFIRPLQRNISLDAVSFSLTNYYSIRCNLNE